MSMKARIDRAFTVGAEADLERLRAIAESDQSRAWEADGATSMSSWLAGRFGMAWGTAREWVRVARALRSLPQIAEAFGAGLLSFDQVRALTRFVTSETDPRWAADAPAWSAAALYREAERHRKITERDTENARLFRSVRMWPDEESRNVYLSGQLPAEEGAAVKAALEARAEEIVLADEAAYPAEARMADALVELVTGSSERAGDAVLVVHADAAVLAGVSSAGPELAETEDGIQLTPREIRRMACDARVEWVLESAGRPIGIGQRSRNIPARIVRLLRFRDQGQCRFPGCARRRWLKAHHLIHWADGGPTDLDNLVLLCHAHHRLLHEGGWRTSGHPARELRFHDPRGRALTSFAAATGTRARAA